MTVTPVILDELAGQYQVIKWETVTTAETTADTVLPWKVPDLPAEIVVHAYGTFGGGAIGMKGSNDNTNYVPLNEPGGAAMSLDADGIDSIRDGPLYIKPSATGGTSDDVDVIAMIRWV